MEKEKSISNSPLSEPTNRQPSERAETPKSFGNFEFRRKPRGDQKKRFSTTSPLDRVILETKRVSETTAGGRRFSFAALGLVREKNKELVTFAYTKGKEVPTAFQKMLRKAQRTFTHFTKEKPTSKVFPFSPRTVPRDIEISYKNFQLRIFPAPSGSGIRAGGVLRKLFKIIGFKDISAKIIGSGSNLNVTQAAFLALSKINWDKVKNKKEQGIKSVDAKTN